MGMGRMTRKKKLTILSSIGGGIGIVSYAAFTINPALGTAAPIILAFATCPAMCAAMGGAMWIQRRKSKKKASSSSATAAEEEQISKEHSKSCYVNDKKRSSIEASRKKQEKVVTVARETEMLENKKKIKYNKSCTDMDYSI